MSSAQFTSNDSVPIEIELKLAIPPRMLARVRRHTLLRGNRVQHRVRSVYYDTPEFDLWRQGIAFRIRRDGKRWLQTLKGGGSASGGLHQRMELESEIAGPHPDFAKLDSVPQAATLLLPQWRARLTPMFTTDFQRVRKKIELNQIVIMDVAIDHGEIVSGDQRAPICELELELISGPTSALFDAALRLLESLPLAIENRSKAERGYALARGENPRPVKTHAAILATDDSGIAAFKTMAAMLLAQMQANRQGTLAGEDPEYLHQLRVALRRLRSMLGAYAKALGKPTLINELKWLARALGPARDADVFATEIWPPLRAALSANPLLTTLDAIWHAQQRRHAATAKRALNAKRYQRLMLTFSRWLATATWREPEAHADLERLAAPAREFAQRVLKRRDACVRDYGHSLTRCDAEQLHQLRINIKKLRYAVDAFATLFKPQAADELLIALSSLQDVLGKMNDVAVAERLISEALADQSDRAATALRTQLKNWRVTRIKALRRKLNPAWRTYRHTEKFW